MRFERLLWVALMVAAPAFAVAVHAGVEADNEQMPAPQTADAQKSARDYIEFSTQLTADCMLHRAQLQRIANTHPDRVIQVVLVSYTGKTRSQGRSVKRLAPGGESEALGCNGSGGLDRHWVILSAEFVQEPGTKSAN